MTPTKPTYEQFRASVCDVPALGFRLDLSRLLLAPDFLSRMEAPMRQVFSAMQALEAGAVANPDEGRRVGHYWLRNPALAPEPALRQAIEGALARIDEFVAGVHAATIKPPAAPRFERVLLIGIGGSALGPQFVADALGGPDDPMKISFFDNTDPDGFDRVLDDIADDLGKTLTVVVSKSGGTKETRNGMLEAAARYKAWGLDFPKYAVAVTGEGSELDKLAAGQGWLARFPMWDWVGGRTSETSAVGILPAALQGLDTTALLDGAREMDAATRVWEVKKNPAALLTLAWYHATGGGGKVQKDMVILPYKDRLLLFSRYLQQLVMESLGKEKDLQGKVVNQGIAVYGNKGSTDQHAYVQQLRDGVNNFFITFIEVLLDRPLDTPESGFQVEEGVTSGDYLLGFLLGTRSALYEKHRESITLTVPDVSARTVGALIALYERAVGFYAALVGINAYDQPGVEAGKKAAASVLAVQKKLLGALDATPRTAAQLAEKIGAPEEAETIFHLAEHLAANQRIERIEGATLFDAQYRAGG